MIDACAMLQTLARRFVHFAEHDCIEDALYVALCRLLADRPQALELLLEAEPSQRKPNLLLAALHARVLAGGASALRPYYASAGGAREPDAALADALDAALRDEHDALVSLVAARSTQTNEIGRCAVLWPALIAAAARHGCGELALLDFGCSAGLNLGVDQYRYDYGDDRLGAWALPTAPRLTCRLVGGAALPHDVPPPRIVLRLGIDPAPVDVADNEQRAWLHACLWPGDRERTERLSSAVAIARRECWPVVQHADCTAAIEPWLDSLPSGVLPVVFSSFVLMYFERPALVRHIATMRSLAREREMLWLSAEGPGLPISDAPVPPPPRGIAGLADDELVRGSTWWLVDGDGDHCVARAHPHGRWMQWLGLGPRPPATR